jgi:hypothetical protein
MEFRFLTHGRDSSCLFCFRMLRLVCIDAFAGFNASFTRGCICMVTHVKVSRPLTITLRERTYVLNKATTKQLQLCKGDAGKLYPWTMDFLMLPQIAIFFNFFRRSLFQILKDLSHAVNPTPRRKFITELFCRDYEISRLCQLHFPQIVLNSNIYRAVYLTPFDLLTNQVVAMSPFCFFALSVLFRRFTFTFFTRLIISDGGCAARSAELLHVFELWLRLKFISFLSRDSTFFTHRSNHSGRCTANQTTDDDHSPTTHHITTNPSPPLRLASVLSRPRRPSVPRVARFRVLVFYRLAELTLPSSA